MFYQGNTKQLRHSPPLHLLSPTPILPPDSSCSWAFRKQIHWEASLGKFRSWVHGRLSQAPTITFWLSGLPERWMKVGKPKSWRLPLSSPFGCKWQLKFHQAEAGDLMVHLCQAEGCRLDRWRVMDLVVRLRSHSSLRTQWIGKPAQISKRYHLSLSSSRSSFSEGRYLYNLGDLIFWKIRFKCKYLEWV